MNKKSKRIISFLCAATFLSSSAYAMELDYFGKNTVLFTDGKSKLHFMGKASGNKSNRMATIFVMMPGKTLADVQNPTDVAYTRPVSVAFDGSFEYEFGFDGDSGMYPVYILCDDEKFEDVFNYKSQNDIIAFFNLIKNGTVKYTDIEEYSEVLGLDLSVVAVDKHKTTVINRILEKKNSITNDNASVDIIKNVLINCKTEFEYLGKIKNASNWSVIPSVIADIQTLTGVQFNYKGASKQDVCKKLIGKEFTSAELLKEAFDKAVADALENKNTGGGGGGSSSGGGNSIKGGGSTGNFVTNEHGVSAPANVKDNTNVNAFNDISDVEWAVKPINYLYNKGIVNGTGDGKFSPDNLLKREEIVKIIVNTFNLMDDAAVSTFDDTDEAMWHYKFIASAQSKGIVSGISENKFGVGEYVTRQDIAVMIYNAAAVSGRGFTKTKTDFSDYDEVAEYAKTAVSSMAGDGIINGMGDGRFAPGEFATRAQAAKMIYQILE